MREPQPPDRLSAAGFDVIGPLGSFASGIRNCAHRLPRATDPTSAALTVLKTRCSIQLPPEAS